MSESEVWWFKEVWESVCPCRLIKKNIVLWTITVLCFVLVIWWASC